MGVLHAPRLAADRILVWDGWIRLNHWLMAAAIPAMWWTSENHAMEWHRRIGLGLLALLVFRFAWGFVGSETARFSQFVRGPAAVLAYLRGKNERAGQAGHNPLGGWSVLAMLLAMTVQVVLGLFAGDPDDGVTGPLNAAVSFSAALATTEWHETFFNAIVALIALHLAAIAIHRLVKRDDLIGPMITGRRKGASGQQQPGMAGPVRALWCWALAIGLAGWVGAGAPGVAG